jgi:hypothetical protein
MSKEKAATHGPQPGEKPVEDGTLLHRRIHPVHYKRQPDGSFRIRDGAFKNPRDRLDMSVQLGDTMADIGLTPNDLVSEFGTDWGVAAISVKVANDEDQTVERTPREHDEAHGDVVGEKPTSRRKRFAAAACWTVQPEPA